MARARRIRGMNIDGIGALVAEIRHRRGLSQQDFAVRAHLTVSTISNLERGRVPDVRTLAAVAVALGVSVDFLLRGDRRRDYARRRRVEAAGGRDAYLEENGGNGR